MNASRFEQITGKYGQLKIAVVGDFCLDRYLEIDSAKSETSLETGLPVHNVVSVRAQPGGAGTIVSNLSALDIGEIFPVGFCGDDGEGFELRRALSELPHVNCRHFFSTNERRTFTYCKPLVLTPGQPPIELNRLDSKNWTPTPGSARERIFSSIAALRTEVDAFILLDQVDVPETGVITSGLLKVLGAIIRSSPSTVMIADSRKRLKDFPACGFKVNRKEFCEMAGLPLSAPMGEIKERATVLARKESRRVFVTLSEEGIVGAQPDGSVEQAPAFPLRGPIDIVGAGDAVTANLTSALAAGAGLGEALKIASAAASIVIHQLGTTGTATIPQIGKFVGW